MANICVYHVVIKGKKNNALLMAGALPVMDDKEIVDSYGTDEKYTVLVKGDCKWTLTAYQSRNEDLKEISVPEDEDEAYMKGNDFWYVDFDQMADLLGVELHTAEIDIDDPMMVGERNWGVVNRNLTKTEEEFLTLEDVLEEYGIDPDSMEEFDFDEDEIEEE